MIMLDMFNVLAFKIQASDTYLQPRYFLTNLSDQKLICVGIIYLVVSICNCNRITVIKQK